MQSKLHWKINKFYNGLTAVCNPNLSLYIKIKEVTFWWDHVCLCVSVRIIPISLFSAIFPPSFTVPTLIVWLVTRLRVSGVRAGEWHQPVASGRDTGTFNWKRVEWESRGDNVLLLHHRHITTSHQSRLSQPRQLNVSPGDGWCGKIFLSTLKYFYDFSHR